MNGFTERQASDAVCLSSPTNLVLTLEQAESMLPLVRHIVHDLCESRARLTELRVEKAHLDSRKQSLTWPHRSRRYSLNEEIALQIAHVEQVKSELRQLGVALITGRAGKVGFPTIVNNRRAFFSWQLGETSVRYWHFARNLKRRVIPDSWKQSCAVEMRASEQRSA